MSLYERVQAIKEAKAAEERRIQKEKEEAARKWEEGGIDRVKADLPKIEDKVEKAAIEKAGYYDQYRCVSIDTYWYGVSGRRWIKEYFEKQGFKVEEGYRESCYDSEMGNMPESYWINIYF